MKIVIIGSGYAGIWAYRAITRWLGRKADITVVTKTNYHSFHGFIGEVLAGNLAAHLTASPLDECFPKANHVIGAATAIDPAGRTVQVTTDAGEHLTLTYDQIVVTTGAEENTAKVPGLTEHGWRLRTPGIPHQLVQRLTDIADRSMPGSYNADSTVVIVGAGFSGTESAAALKRRFGNRINVYLVTTTATVIQDWAQAKFLQKHLERNLQLSGVNIIRGTRVSAVDATSVTLQDGRVIPTSTVIASLGNRGLHINGLEAFIEPNTQLLHVDQNLQVTDGVWAAGDNAAVKNVRGEYVVKDALWAIAAGTRVGRNISRVARNRKPRPFGFRGLGSVASFAPGASVGSIFGIPINGYLMYVLRQTLFMWFVPSRINAVRMMRSFWEHRTAGREHLRMQTAAAETA